MAISDTRVDSPTIANPGRIVVAMLFVTLGLTYGIWYSYSVLLVALLREFGWTRSVLAGAFSAFVMVHGLSGPVLGWLVERLGPRRVLMLGGAIVGAGLVLTAETRTAWHLYLSFGIIAAAGVSAAGWVPAVILVRGWFPSHIATALGIASAGIGMGIFALVPFTQLLIEQVGWRWTLRALGVLIAAWVIPSTALLVRDPPERAEPVPLTRPALSVEPGLRDAMTVAPHWTLSTAVRS